MDDDTHANEKDQDVSDEMAEASPSTEQEQPQRMAARWIVGLVLVCVLVIGYAYLVTGAVEIIATVDDSQAVKGRVFYRSEPLSSVKIWAVATGQDNRQGLSEFGTTDDEGDFELKFASPAAHLKAITITARTSRTLRTGLLIKKGEIVVTAAKNKIQNLGSLTPLAIAGLAFFGISIVVAFLGLRLERYTTLCYYTSIAAAVLLSVGMVWYVAASLRIIGTSSDDQIFKLGFATIFQGSYADDVADEWIFSLTAAPRIGTSDDGDEKNVDGGEEETVAYDRVQGGANDPAGNRIGDKTEDENTASARVTGFGAPLWVLFLSVMGAAVFTLALIVKGINRPVKFGVKKEVRARFYEIVQHQFFILFSPLGGIFLYQTLLLSGAVKEPLTVAFAALGAGVSLNLILARAVSTFEKWMSPSDKVTEPDGSGSGPPLAGSTVKL